jgi:hypothetical protein
MFYFFDESGDFSVPKSRAHHKVAVVMGVAVSDAIYDDLNAGFRQFVNSPLPLARTGNPRAVGCHMNRKKRFAIY